MVNRREFFSGTMCLGAAVAAGLSAGAEDAVRGQPVVSKSLGKATTLPPGRYDEHIHIYEDTEPKSEMLAARMAEAGMVGGCVYSRQQSPEARLSNTTRMTPEQIVDHVIAWCSASPTLYPFFWIDPSRPDAVELVDMAVEKGIYGFKVIRDNGFPCDGFALDAYRRMAHYGKPLTFHSGILYDGIPSSEYFRPVAFEPMLRVPHLRFCLAHISWPWCDECLALFGKMRDAGWRLRANRKGGSNPDVPMMYIDTTPGPRQIWRRDALQKMYTTFFRKSINNRLMFGTDCSVHNYRVAHCREFQDFDDALFREMGLTGEEIDAYYRTALQAYLFG